MTRKLHSVPSLNRTLPFNVRNYSTSDVSTIVQQQTLAQTTTNYERYQRKSQPPVKKAPIECTTDTQMRVITAKVHRSDQHKETQREKEAHE